MNDDRLIETALNRRFAEAGTPPYPAGLAERAFRDSTPRAEPAAGVPRRLAWAAAGAAMAVIVGVTAPQASSAARSGYAEVVMRLRDLTDLTRPVTPGIHVGDRLTIEEAQRRMPFQIVEPAGMPQSAKLLYAHVLRDDPHASVMLLYEAHVGARYYPISIVETASPAPPRNDRIVVRVKGQAERTFHVQPGPRWKHDAIVMDLQSARLLPGAMVRAIVAANTR